MPSPPALGRSLVVSSQPTTVGPDISRWDDSPSFVIDAELLKNPPKLEAVVHELHELWTSRTPFVAQLFVEPSELRSPQHSKLSPWELGAGFTFLRERLQFLIWRNSYDGRGEELIWWWAKKGESLGAEPSEEADLMVDGTHVWIDGGPRGSQLGLDMISAESIELGQLLIETGPVVSESYEGLDKSQSAAVLAPLSTARIVAPAGSGKTRTMVARVSHLLQDRGVQPSLITVLAYNKKAQEELKERLGVVGNRISVRTFHSLAFAIVNSASPRRLQVLNEVEVRNHLARIARVTPRPNVDPIAPFIEAATEVRLGLLSPAEVELKRDDVPDFRDVFERFRTRMRDSQTLDFEEMIYRAIEILLEHPDHRAHWQAQCRHVLVDEFQDLTPAFLLLLRLVSSPGLQVFGVGDDDQTIYGYLGANPSYLVEYQDLFPGATIHALSTNYRSPNQVVKAVNHLLTYNSKRVGKDISAGPEANDDPESLTVELLDHARIAASTAQTVKGWLDAGTPATQISVLSRVNTTLLPVVAALRDNGVEVSVEIPPFVGRTAVAAALSWLKLGLDPDHLQRTDLMRAVRRPKSGLVREAENRLERHPTLSLSHLRTLGSVLSGRKAASWNLLCDNIALVSRSVGGTTSEAVEVILYTLGLSAAAELLDKRRTASNSAHGDDLVSLERLAAQHKDPTTFADWLDHLKEVESIPSGVRLATIHKVKGAEWNNVIVFGVDANSMPHRLSDDQEEERRILHVGVTRGRQTVRILANSQSPSPFLEQLTHDYVRSKEPKTVKPRTRGLTVNIGDRLRMSGGYEAEVLSIDDASVLAQIIDSAATVRIHWGQHVSFVDGRSGTLTLPDPEASHEDSALVERLKEWRRATATQKGMPAYVILHDSSITEIARERPTTERALLGITGVGPSKLEAYGEDILDLIKG